MILAWLACATPDAPRSDAPAPSDSAAVGDSEAGHPDPDALHVALSGTWPWHHEYRGERLEPPLPLPDFEVLNQAGLSRDPGWLVGDPTVIWFFRDAGTST